MDRLESAGLNITLVSTLAAPLPDDFYPSLWKQALTRPNVTGLSSQPATYGGRFHTPDDMETRITFPDVIKGLAKASAGMDAYNFDVRQLRKCCTHHVLPSGHVVPFCAFNTLYRSGHLKLPPLDQST